MQKQVTQRVDPGFEMFVRAEREAGAQEGAVEVQRATDADAPVVKLGAAAARGGVQFILERVEHHCLLEPALVLQTDGYRKLGVAVKEVGGAVERVDDPEVIITWMLAGFFRKNAVVRIGRAHGPDDFGLGHAVDLAHQVVTPLGFDRQTVEPVEMAHNNAAGAARSADRCVEHRVHENPRFWKNSQMVQKRRALYRRMPVVPSAQCPRRMRFRQIRNRAILGARPLPRSRRQWAQIATMSDITLGAMPPSPKSCRLPRRRISEMAAGLKEPGSGMAA